MSSERRDASESGGYRPKRQKKSGWDVQEVQPAADPAVLQQLSIQKTAIAAAGAPAKPGNRIYVGEPDIVALFSAFGPVIKSEMTMDPMTGRSKGFCFIEYADAETAQAAMAMDGFDLAGRRLKVGRPFHGQTGGMGQNGASLSLAMSMGLAMTNQTQSAPVNPLMTGLNVLGSSSIPKTNSSGQLLLPSSIGSTSSSSSSSVAGTTMCCLLVKNIDSEVPIGELTSIFGAFGEVKQCKYLDKDRLPDLARYTKAAVVEYPTVALALSTSGAMNKFVLAGLELSVEVCSLDRLTQLTSVDDSTFTKVLLRDMVTLEDAEDPDLKDEITEEASQYGRVEHVVIEVKDTVGGKQEVVVELKYKDALDSHKAHKALNGRAFGGKKINAVLAP